MFPERLKGLRKNKKNTQQDIANFLGITRQGFAKYENSQAELETLKKLAAYYSVSIDYLIGYSDEIEYMTDEEVDKELKEHMSEMKVWYKDEPKDKKLRGLIAPLNMVF